MAKVSRTPDFIDDFRALKALSEDTARKVNSLSLGAGVSDHGLLTGLGDDDHAQYHNDARALTWLAARNVSDLADVDAKTGTGTTVVMQGSPTLTAPTIVDFTNAQHDHGDADDGGLIPTTSVSGLAAELALYALLAGRAGGQTLIGGTGSGDALTLYGTSHATRGPLNLGQFSWINLKTDSDPWTMTGQGGYFDMTTAFNLSTAGDIFRLVDMRPTITVGADPSTAAIIQLFNYRVGLNFTGNRALGTGGLPSPIVAYNLAGTIGMPDTGAAQTVTGVGLWGVGLQTALNARGHASSVMTILEVFGLKHKLGNWNRSGYTIVDTGIAHMVLPSGTAAASWTNLYGILVEDLSTWTVTGIKALIRNKSADMPIRSAGAAVFGSDSAPTNASVGIELLSTTKALLPSRMTTAQRTALTALDGMIVYDTDLAAHMLREGGAWTDTHETVSAPALVTVLPGTPANGDEVYYDTGTAGVIWHLRYNSSAVGSYKWEFLGGPPLYAEVTTIENSASTTYVNLTTTGPSITVPLAGDYDVEIGCRDYLNTTVPSQVLMSYAIGATAAVDADSIDHYTATVNQSNVGSRSRRKTALAASTALVAKYRSPGGGTAYWQDRWMLVRPIRLG